MKIYLYIKTHNITKLKYFGKTVRNPLKYNGSGKYWKRHLKTHGNNVSTRIVGEFENIEDCILFAIKFSKENNIIDSDEWANLQLENGLDGCPIGGTGYKFTKEDREKIATSSKEMWKDNIKRNKIIESHKSRWTPELKMKQSIRLKNEFWTDERKKSHSNKMKGRIPFNTNLKGIKKCEGHGKNVSLALKGIKKSESHKRSLALSRQKNKKTLIDHLSNSYEIHSDFCKKYKISNSILEDLNSKIYSKDIFNKLGIDYELNKNKTKTELGFKFI